MQTSCLFTESPLISNTHPIFITLAIHHHIAKYLTIILSSLSASSSQRQTLRCLPIYVQSTCSRSKPSSHSLQPVCKLRIFLLYFQLCSCGFSVRKGVDDFAFGSGELGGALKVLESFCYFALLEQKLGFESAQFVHYSTFCIPVPLLQQQYHIRDRLKIIVSN